MGNEPKQFSPEGNDHPTAREIGEWLGGVCPAAAQDRLRRHFIHCSECREGMVMIRQATQPRQEIEQTPDFEGLLRLGERAAREAHDQYGRPRESPSARAAIAPAERPRRWDWLPRWQPLYGWAAVALLALAVAGPVYWLWRGNQPVDRAMASLRNVWSQSRPIEARVTGGFPYLPYQLTRGAGETIAVDQGQLLAAAAELAREVADRPTPHARHALGRLHLLKEEFVQAEEQLKLVTEQEPRNSLAHIDLASVYYERGVREESVPQLAQAAELLTKATEISPKLAEAWFNLALCHERMVLPAQAQADWKKYLELDSSSPWAAEARVHLERLVNPNKSFVAPGRLAESLSAAASHDDEEFRQLALNNFIAAFNLAREDFLDKYLDARTAGDRLAAAKYLDLMRRTARLAKEEKAEHYLSDLVAFVADAKQPVIGKVGAIRSLLRQGDRNHEKGNYTDALSSYEQAAAAAALIRDVCHAEQARYGLARIYIHSIETPKRQMLREKLARETGERHHKVFHAWSLLALANALGAAQLPARGLEASIAAYRTAEPLGDTDTVVNSLRFSGAMYTVLGDYESAVARNFQAIRMASERPVRPLRSCQAYLRMAETFNLAFNPHIALAYQLEAVGYCQRTGNPSHSISARSLAGQYYALTGQARNAAVMFGESIAELEKYEDKLGQTLQKTELSILTGDAYFSLMRTEDSISAYQTALGLIAGNRHPRYLAMAHQGLAMAFLRKQQYVDAEKELRLSIALAEEVRKNIGDARSRSVFRNRKMGVYRTMVDFQFVARNDMEKAFYYAELSRNRELFDVIASQSEINWDEHQARLEDAVAGEAPDLKLIQSVLPNNAQLVEYAVTDQHLLIWLVTNQHWKSYSVPINDRQLQQLCAEYLTELQSTRDVEALNNKAAALYRTLVEPLAHDLELHRILVVVPDGILGAIPFQSLFSEKLRRYLIEDYALVTIPSAGILAHTLKLGKTGAQRRPESLLILSDPKFDPKQFPSLKPLQATEREAAEIASHYASSLSLSREQATKSRLLQNIDRYGTIHLATHSITNERNPLLSSVILSPDGQSVSATVEGNLRAFEIFGLKLTCPRLVILSSCRSGLNAQSASNGLGGLAHAFFKAGVPAVIASLWDVEDQSAAELMKSFHYFHKVDKQPFCQALRGAQLRMLNERNSPWKHPYYWAAFQFSGNGFTS